MLAKWFGVRKVKSFATWLSFSHIFGKYGYGKGMFESIVVLDRFEGKLEL